MTSGRVHSRPSMRLNGLAWVAAVAVLMLWVCRGDAQAQTAELRADLNETVARVSATVTLLDGRTHTGNFVVTHLRPDGVGPFPIVVLSHGRDIEKRSEVPRYRMLHVAEYWLNRGFAVFVPTRIGYGDSGLEPDADFSGDVCGTRDFWPGFRSAAEQIKETVAFAQVQPWADATRVILMGQSYGGFASIVATSLNVPGVIGAINTAGTSGAVPDVRPGRPCSPEALQAVAWHAGRTSRVPQIWIYADNDTYAGPPLPASWHQAFNAAGGSSTFIPLAPLAGEGHFIIDDLSNWRRHGDAFLTWLGFVTPRTPNKPPATSFARIDDGSALPHVNDDVRATRYKRFLKLDLPRAFALSPGGAWAYRTGPRALEDAIADCNGIGRGACQPYVVDDDVVWTGR